MNKKFIGVIISILVLLVIVFLGNIATSYNDVDSSYYVLASQNTFSKIGILINDCMYYVVDIILGGISSIFNMFLG